MKKRLWEGKWKEGKIIDVDTPFGRPFYKGECVYFRPCDVGVACFIETSGKASIRYLSQYQADTSFGNVKECNNTEELDCQFELLREEVRAGAAKDEPISVIGEVAVPFGVPTVYSTAIVHVAESLSNLIEPCWLADWFFDRDGRMHIAFEKQVLYYAISSKSEKWIEKTLKHEAFEARAGLREAKKDYGEISPAEYDTLATQFGGVCHAMTVRVIEGIASEKSYNKQLDAWVEKGHLPSPPLQHELT